MSGSATNFGDTLTGGIQDVSALLPIIGTEQCEKHVGSALEGGFLYAIATPLSLFGSLGIVKAGVSVLIASISIPKPSLSFTPLPGLSFTSSRRLWCGARVLDDAGFKLVGSVAPLIGMDAKRYNAESRLIEILEKKHVDTRQDLSVEWRSTGWNISLVIGTIIAASISGTPYLYLLLKDPPGNIHSPWVFPFLRTVGSCLATVCCQFLFQSRVVSLMKSRIVFMIMHQRLVDDLKRSGRDESILGEQEEFRWGDRFPAEECLWSLEQYLLSRLRRGFMHTLLSKVRIPKAQDIESSSDFDDVGPFPHSSGIEPFSDPDCILHTLLRVHAGHFPHLHRAFTIVSWFLLLVSLPAAVVGYIGCFTIVSNSESSGPLVWLGLEAVLSVLRIILWAWNPSFDERAGVEVSLKLEEEVPPITTHWDIDALRVIDDCQVPVVSQQEFLEDIAPYTGPLSDFRKPDNTELSFVLTVNKEHTQTCLLMMVRGRRDRFTLYHGSDNVLCFRTSFTLDNDTATIHWNSPISKDYLPKNLHNLLKYYDSLLRSLDRPGNHLVVWSLGPNDESAGRNQYHESASLNLTARDILRLQQSREHHLKTSLMQTLGKWIVDGVEAMYRDGHNSCYLTLADPTSDVAKQELYAFNVLFVQEWIKRELDHLRLSVSLENVLRLHVQQNAEKPGDPKLKMSFSWSHDLQMQRLKHERGKVEVRKEDIIKAVGKGRLEPKEFVRVWQEGRTFVEKKWKVTIEAFERSRGSSELPEVATEHVHEWFGNDDTTRTWVKQLKPRFSRWTEQRSYERREMKAMFKQISNADATQLEQAYKYPESSAKLAARIHSRYVELPKESALFVAKVSSATVYDVQIVGSDNIASSIIRTVAEKTSCRSLIHVHSHLVKDIPENDHLLFCSNRNHREVDLPFIQRNRDRWKQQKTDSWTFYLSPRGVDTDGRYVYSDNGTIAHILVFLQTPRRLRLHLLHCRPKDDMMLSIQEKGKELRLVHTAEISKNELRLEYYDLDWIGSGPHELQLVVSKGRYHIRDIILEPVNDPWGGTIVSNLTYSD